MELFCRVCDGRNEFPHNWVSEGDVCQFCGQANQWRTLNEPKKAWVLNHNDRRLLKAMLIAAE